MWRNRIEFRMDRLEKVHQDDTLNITNKLDTVASGLKTLLDEKNGQIKLLRFALNLAIGAGAVASVFAIIKV